MRIELVIDEIVLHGFDPRHRHAIGDAVERELARLARDHAGTLATRRPLLVDRADAGSFGCRAGAAPGSAGTAIANAVFGVVRGGAP